jgi:hypothetical protein
MVIRQKRGRTGYIYQEDVAVASPEPTVRPAGHNMLLTREEHAVSGGREWVEEGEAKLHLPPQNQAPTSAFGQARTKILYQALERSETWKRRQYDLSLPSPHLPCHSQTVCSPPSGVEHGVRSVKEAEAWSAPRYHSLCLA